MAKKHSFSRGKSVLPVPVSEHGKLVLEGPNMLRRFSHWPQILLVDDDRYGSAIRKELLEAQLGLKVWYFEDPKQALLNVDLANWDLVITDFHMPGLNGMQFAEAVRQSHPSLPILMITGGLLTALPTETVSAVLDKAMPPEKFLAAVSSLVSQYQSHEKRIQCVS